MKRFGSRLLLAALAIGAAAAAPAATVWDESINGDFSGLYNHPSILSLGAGSNVILGMTGNPGTGTDRDYFTFIVPSGGTVTSITLLDNTFVSGGVSFMGLQVGSPFSKPANETQATDLLGFVHYDTGMVGTSLLPFLQGTFNGLPSGVYTAWVQDTGGGSAEYGFDFVLSGTPVPLPGAAWLLVSGVLGLGAVRRRNRAQAA